MNENKQAEPVGLCGHESCDCRGYCQKLKANPVQPVACIGTNGELLWLNKPSVIYDKPIPLYTHLAPPVQPAVAQEIKGWLITSKADENEGFVTKRPDDWNNSDWKKEPLYTAPPAAAINEPDPSECFNAAIDYALKCGNGDGGLEFLVCWREGNFDAIRREWPDAPKSVFQGAEAEKARGRG